MSQRGKLTGTGRVPDRIITKPGGAMGDRDKSRGAAKSGGGQGNGERDNAQRGYTLADAQRDTMKPGGSPVDLCICTKELDGCECAEPNSTDPEAQRMLSEITGVPLEKIQEIDEASNPFEGADSFYFFETLLDEAHPSSRMFYDHLLEAALLHKQKQADYGKTDDPFSNVRASEEWGIPGWIGACVRLNDKVRRLQTLATKGELANEAVKDSFLDIAVYALIALVLHEQDTQKG